MGRGAPPGARRRRGDAPRVRKGANGEDGYSGFTMRDPVTGETTPTELEALLRDARRSSASSCAASRPTTASTRPRSTRSRLGFETFVLDDAIAAGRPRAGRRRAGDRRDDRRRLPALVTAPARADRRADRRCSSTSSTRPTSCSAPTTRRGRRSSAATASSCRGVSGLCDQLLYLLREEGATHVGCATDRVIESFRNDLFPGYKSSAGMPPELLDQFPIAEEAIEALGLVALADGRVRGRRRDRRRRRPLRRRPGGRADPDLHARQGHGPARRGRPGRPAGTGAAGLIYDDAGVRAKWGVAAGLDPGLARARRRLVRRLSRACPAGARSRRRPCCAVYGSIDGDPAAGEQVGGPEPPRRAGARRDAPRPHATRRMLYRSLARLRTADDGVADPPEDGRRSSSGAARRARRWEAFCDDWGLDRLRDRPHRWLEAS